jgi:DNA-binding FadR family transcriptional regulator
MTSAELLHQRVLAGLRQVIASNTTSARNRRAAERRLAEVLTVGRTQGWNE